MLSIFYIYKIRIFSIYFQLYFCRLCPTKPCVLSVTYCCSQSIHVREHSDVLKPQQPINCRPWGLDPNSSSLGALQTSYKASIVFLVLLVQSGNKSSM